MSTKFYVFGGGRWRELDLNTGRVSGWAKSARIVVARNGRLECSRNEPILRSLRALAAGEASRARDGPRLPYTRWTQEERQSQKQYPNSPCQHCCHHRYTAVVENVCKHVPPEPVRPPHVLPLSHQPAPAPTQALATDEIFDKLRNECVNEPEQRSIPAQVRSPQKSATRASSVSRNELHPATRRFKRQRISSSSSIEFMSNDISNKIYHQRNEKRIHLEKGKKKLERRGRPPKQSPANILGVVAAAVPIPNLNSKQPLCITSDKWNCASTPNKTDIVPRNGEVSNTQLSPEPRLISEQSSVPNTANEDSQATSDKSDTNETSDESGNRSDDDESQHTIETSAILAHKLHSGGHAAAGGQNRQHETAATTKVCKELVIEESDVIALRGFLRRSAPGVSLNRFDSDDEYKRGIFYRLHPLVSMERSARIQQMLKGDDDISLRDFASQLGLRSISDDPLPHHETPNGTLTKTSRTRKQPDRYSEVLPQPSKSPVKKLFASAKSLSRKKTLSKSSTPSKKSAHKSIRLTSPLAKSKSHNNAESKLSPSFKTRARKKADSLSQSPSPIKTVVRENDMSKPSATTKTVASEHGLATLFGSSKTAHRNVSKSSALTKTTDRKKVALNSSPTKNITANENGVSSKTAVTLSSDETASKSRTLPKPIASPLLDQPRGKLKSAKPPRVSKGGKEYCPSEDTAIVDWVSSEDRARLVNGNRVWRELQSQYERLTGIGRTWQSLRNRYLRYILPSLSSLAVPPARAARLRAAAATGEIKCKRRPDRRNSIFATPGVRGAWSRRPRSSPAPHTPSPSPTPPPPPPPPADDKPSPQAPANNKGNTEPSSDKKAVQRERSTSSSSSSSTSASSVRYPTLRYSDVTRRFARRQQMRYSTESSESSSRSPSPGPTSTRTRRLFNPKAAL